MCSTFKTSQASSGPQERCTLVPISVGGCSAPRAARAWRCANSTLLPAVCHKFCHERMKKRIDLIRWHECVFPECRYIWTNVIYVQSCSYNHIPYSILKLPPKFILCPHCLPSVGFSRKNCTESVQDSCPLLKQFWQVPKLRGPQNHIAVSVARGFYCCDKRNNGLLP